ncbi:MAG: Plasmid pRiA4b ORF-3-like protein [Phormidesmis priestleyi Ana]|uniref:Plasmid pRiA4b ORF-3-like protein n=1 Tax=Phormidesmis priestleyi Ana TaxID=1666911 RepID=A0A0P8BRK6_9CYAN|nr:MAG: Plasmid pRiA4b ORF-3-like protein [Phormidesmis priestleyi Ana]
MVSRKSSKASSIYQMKITMRDIRPPIWRRVQVRSNESLEHLHYVIQLSLGWTNSHLHSFRIQGVEYGMLLPDCLGFDELETHDETTVKLSSVIPGEKFKFSYLYDFGDSWEHEVLVEKVLDADLEIDYPICVKAKRACPPEDCGGIWGYEGFLEAIQDPEHPEHEEMLEWVGGTFDPEDPELSEANHQLKLIDEWKREAEMP